MSHNKRGDDGTMNGNGGGVTPGYNNGSSQELNGGNATGTTANYNFHVELSQENHIHFSPTLGKPFFDECNLELVVINTGEFYRFPLPSGANNKSGDDKPKKYMAIWFVGGFYLVI